MFSSEHLPISSNSCLWGKVDGMRLTGLELEFLCDSRYTFYLTQHILFVLAEYHQ